MSATCGIELLQVQNDNENKQTRRRQEKQRSYRREAEIESAGLHAKNRKYESGGVAAIAPDIRSIPKFVKRGSDRVNIHSHIDCALNHVRTDRQHGVAGTIRRRRRVHRRTRRLHNERERNSLFVEFAECAAESDATVLRTRK
jgi:hypothetical protein